jgi:hypothetical protein
VTHYVCTKKFENDNNYEKISSIKSKAKNIIEALSNLILINHATYSIGHDPFESPVEQTIYGCENESVSKQLRPFTQKMKKRNMY